MTDHVVGDRKKKKRAVTVKRKRDVSKHLAQSKTAIHKYIDDPTPDTIGSYHEPNPLYLYANEGLSEYFHNDIEFGMIQIEGCTEDLMDGISFADPGYDEQNAVTPGRKPITMMGFSEDNANADNNDVSPITMMGFCDPPKFKCNTIKNDMMNKNGVTLMGLATHDIEIESLSVSNQ
eukprot:105134_1